MADAYYRVSHEVIPVYTSTGPGPMLLTAAVANAFYDSSALIAITGQVATTQNDSGALQEEYRHFQSDFPSIAKVITKRSFQAHSVKDLGKFLPKAFKLARTGRPGTGAHRRPVRPVGDEGRRRGATARAALGNAELAYSRLA